MFDVYAQWTCLEGSETLTWGGVLIEAFYHCNCLGLGVALYGGRSQRTPQRKDIFFF